MNTKKIYLFLSSSRSPRRYYCIHVFFLFFDFFEGKASHVSTIGKRAMFATLSWNMVEAGLAPARKERNAVFAGRTSAGSLTGWPATVIMSAAAFQLTRGAAARRKARERPSWDHQGGRGNGGGNAWWTIRTPDR